MAITFKSQTPTSTLKQPETSPPTGYEDTIVWQLATSLSIEIYKHFHKHKNYSFRDQITRASLSIPSNIAEDYERISQKEKVNFYSYAKGSAGELRTQIQIGMEIGYIPRTKAHEWLTQAKALSKMLYGLIHSIQHKTQIKPNLLITK